ncbi:DUF3303 family protein [Methanolobus mangrovi]|uniref:DUF3303 family protein n=1 Tax=Methanolobus mangrovi TaxID=3072977 RepID=A0AA51YJW4_9EURY|nr:DUF3303 family protein [Methanolobus mangrovi]WMW23060.1 DUF3303 family protein [Methanolobus mangrovi]
MLFMDIVTWEPKDTDEVLSRFEKWEYPQGIEVISEWDDLSSCRHIVVYDAKNSEAYLAATFPWRDICYFDSFPVMESNACIKCLADTWNQMPV